MLRQDADPRGMAVFDWRLNRVGRVSELWIDRGIKVIQLLEVELDAASGGTRVLVPIHHTVIREASRRVRVTALWAHQFAEIPMPARLDVITGQEEERLNAYFAAGRFFRGSPLVAPRASGPLWDN